MCAAQPAPKAARVLLYKQLHVQTVDRSMDPDPRKMKEKNPLQCCACFVLKGQNLNSTGCCFRLFVFCCSWKGGGVREVHPLQGLYFGTWTLLEQGR